ncbi:hypothetical protein DND132_1160 [Pseudodesulfovibrio mercurii]|uniref:Uncharacterized protein n=1 Tax=Pseudodesulfovibrio mercurii TaxID=641491 RepID=F0JBY0_9BACT|nr:hypothetical protein [Pseudodesulfovibrio mercurii]EGB14373.1 hypothetical protein DND132_1160 [Pseudodesulfovibrio mercurii]
MGRTLVLGLAAGYHYGDVRPFLASLDRAAYAGDLVLFVSETTRDLERLRAHGAELLPMVRRPGLEDVPCNALRYFLYLDFLKGADVRWERILISDVRDVVFQRDPFTFAWPDGLCCTLEDPSATVGSCPFNGRWVREHLGAEALNRIADRPVSCSGTTVADHAAMVAYLERMTGRLLPPSTGECMAGYDQGVHNYLIHTGALGDPTLFDNTGPILTLAQTRGEPEVNGRGEVLNRAGRVAHLIHQYDRKPSLFRMIRERFA